MLAPMRPRPTMAICMSARLPRSRAGYREKWMDVLERNMAGVKRAHSSVVAALQALTDADIARPSLLPDWTIGHVATHIARNAEGHVRMFTAAARGDVAVMYPGGREQRTNDIEAGSRRSAAAIATDVAD